MIRSDPSDLIEAAHPEPAKTPNKRRPWTIRGLIITVGVIAFLFKILLVLGKAAHEPLARSFNGRYQRTADKAHFIGRPEVVVLAVLGEPRSVYAYDAGNGVPGKTFRYTHSPSCSGGFRVHCQQGVVRRLGQVDD